MFNYGKVAILFFKSVKWLWVDLFGKSESLTALSETNIFIPTSFSKIFLGTVKAKFYEPNNWTEYVAKAFEEIIVFEWRKCPSAVVLIVDTPSHVCKFCETLNYEEQIPRMDIVLRNTVSINIHLSALRIING